MGPSLRRGGELAEKVIQVRNGVPVSVGATRPDDRGRGRMPLG